MECWHQCCWIHSSSAERTRHGTWSERNTDQDKREAVTILDPLITDVGPIEIMTVRKPGESEESQADRHREKIRAVIAAIRSHAGIAPVPYETRRGVA